MNQPNILIIDAQGGGIGRQLVAAVRQELPQARITAVGANGAATAAMLKAGAESMLGEITPRMAAAVAQSGAKRILIPFDHCDNIIVGVAGGGLKARIREAAAVLAEMLGQ